MTDTNELQNTLNGLVAPFGIANTNRVQEYQEKIEKLITAQTQAAYKRGYIDGGIEQLIKADKKG